MMIERRSKILRAQNNDEGGKEDGYQITEINGVAVTSEAVIPFEGGEIFITRRGSLSIRPAEGMTMEALFLPPPEKVWSTFLELNAEGYQGCLLYTSPSPRDRG